MDELEYLLAERLVAALEGIEDALQPKKTTGTRAEPMSKTWLEDFERWWQAYPSKKGKKPCKAIWKRRQLDADLLIADTLNRIKNDEKWIGGYIPNPSTYLNQDRWEDDVTQSQERLEANPETWEPPLALQDELKLLYSPRDIERLLENHTYTDEEQFRNHAKLMLA